MNMERAALKGQLVDARKQLKELDMLASGQLMAARNYLNPYLEDVTELNTEKAVVQVKALHETTDKMRALKERINKLEDALDG